MGLKSYGIQGFSLCPSCSFRTAYIFHGSLGTWLLTQSVPWENVVCINKMHHSFSTDMYNTKYVHICLITPIVMQLLDFYSSYSYLLTFAEEPSIQGTLLKQELSSVLSQPMNSPVSSLLQRKSCGTIHLSVFESWSEATWRPHSLPTCSSGNWNAFLVCSQLQLFFKVNFKNGVCFLKSSKRHSHSMKQRLKSYLFLHFLFVLFKCNAIYKMNSLDYSGF